MGYFIFLTIFDCVWMIIWTILTHQALRLNLVLNVKPENGQSPKPWKFPKVIYKIMDHCGKLRMLLQTSAFFPSQRRD